MNCARIQARLFDYLDGTLDRPTHARVAGHLDGCAECAEFATALASPMDGVEDWTRAILGQTADDPCSQAFARMPDWIDGTLEPVDADLIRGHAAHCAECSALAAVLRAMQADLPALAEIEPDAAFLSEVLAATARPAPARWTERLDAWFATVLKRPRIAWEGAYVATALLALLTVFPGSPLAGAPRKALELARTDPSEIEQPFVTLKTGLNVGAQEAWSSTEFAARALATRASAGSEDAYRKAKRGLGTLWDKIASDASNDGTNHGDGQ